MENTEITNVKMFIEYVNGSHDAKKLSEKYNLNLSVTEAMISYGREEYNNSEYWNTYLKPILQN